MSNQIIEIDTDQWSAALIKTLEKEYASLLQCAESEPCSSIRYEIRTKALGFKNAIEIVSRAIQACKQAQPALSADDAIRMDREYIRGLKAGWNMGIVEDTEKFQAAINARLIEINEANKA